MEESYGKRTPVSMPTAAANRGAVHTGTRAPVSTTATSAEVARSMSCPTILISPALPTRHKFHRVTIAHDATLTSRCYCEKPAPSGRRVVAGRLTTAASSTETCCQARAPNTRPNKTEVDDIPNPTDGPAPIANTGRGPRVGGKRPPTCGMGAASALAWPQRNATLGKTGGASHDSITRAPATSRRGSPRQPTRAGLTAPCSGPKPRSLGTGNRSSSSQASPTLTAMVRPHIRRRLRSEDGGTW